MNEIKRSTDKDFYWGVSDRETAREFIDYSKQNGFQNAINNPKFEVFKKYAASKKRADFIDLLSLNKDSVVLDMGSGYGNITIPLAGKVKEVFAVDGTLELLEFSRERAINENAQNINYFHTDPLDYCNLPFQLKQFDCIILNGVLEWVGTGDMSKKPDIIQENALKYLRSLLKDDGIIYIGIENRFYPMYFYNIQDPHTKRLFTAILPRFVSNLLMKFYGVKEGYRTYIYSLGGYRRLFKRSGLKIEKLYLPLPSYREPNYIVNGNDKKDIDNAFKNNLWNVYHRKICTLLKTFYALGLFKYTTHSFSFILKKRN